MPRCHGFLVPIAAAALLLLGPTAPGAELINVAPFGTATQSTTNGSFVASLALDGNLGNFTHTLNSDNDATWEVELPFVVPIERIVLHNRTSCCGSRLRDITVTIVDEAGDEVWVSDLLNPENELGTFPLGPPQLELDLLTLEGQPVEGRVVRVHRTPDPDFSGGGDGSNLDEGVVLSLGEVEVFVDDAEIPVAIVTHPQGGRKYAGACHVFTVGLLDPGGAASIAYQWYKDDVKIDGATDERLVLGDLKETDAGAYKVEVTVNGSLLVSDPAVLDVIVGNLALSGVATQSTTGYGGPPERAIDGNIDGVYNNASVTHTNGDANGWWQVELFGDSVVDRVVLWNRTDACCPQRLSNFRLSARDAGGNEVWGEDFFTDLSYPIEPSFEIEIDGETCRAIRVERIGPDIDGNNFLSLAEVEVFGDGPLPPPDRLPNLARECGTTAWQSSQLGAYGPALAIDGNYADFTHTLNTDDDATWEVDLQAEHDIALINLYNRSDCCWLRLRDITVSILDAGGDLVWESDLLNPENELGGPGQIALNLIAIEGAPVRGQTVRVRRTPDPDFSGGGTSPDDAYVLSLGEVEVFALPSDCPAAGDTHCEDLLVEGPEDSYPGLYTLTAFADDDSGDPILYTFVIDDGVDAPRTIGPQEGNVVEVLLGPGTWTLSVTVDDDPVCTDAAGDNRCSRQASVVDVENLALGGVATQSSEYNTAQFPTGQFPAPLAIDGNYGSFTHTLQGNLGLGGATWEVDLLSEQPIGRIVLYNRLDCCGSRLRDIIVYILDDAGAVVWESDVLNPENELGAYPLGPRVLTVNVEQIEGGGVEGRIVRVYREPDPDLSGSQGQGNDAEADCLSLGEVEVFPATGAVQKPRFKRGDADALDGVVNITDAIYVLNYLFQGGPEPPCLDAADADDEFAINITDGIYILGFLFLGGAEPPSPGPFTCGPDTPGEDGLGCASYTRC